MKRLLPLLCLILLAVPLPAQYGANGLKKGAWRSRADMPAGWHVTKSGRYVFQSNAPKERIKRIAKHLNAAYRLYNKTFPTGRTPKKPFVVKVFKDRQGFLDYGAPPGAGAYYSWRDKEMVGYDTGKLDGELTAGGTTGQGNVVQRALRSKRTMDTLGVFAHEGWHQYFHFMCASKVDFPSWCDEGIGEYFYTARFRGKKLELGAPNDYRLGTIRNAIKRNKHIPLKDLVTFNQARYYRVAGLAYAEGWSFVHFLMEHPAYKKKRYLKRYMKTFVSEHSIDEAVERVFGRMNWEKTEKDWKAWVMGLEYESTEDIIKKGLGALDGLEKKKPDGGASGGPDKKPDGKKPDGKKPAGGAGKKK